MGWGHGQIKGYHFEHNFDHGQQHLAAFLLTLILLAFLGNTLLDLLNAPCQLLRQALAAWRIFFNDLQAFTRYWAFDSWCPNPEMQTDLHALGEDHAMSAALRTS